MAYSGKEPKRLRGKVYDYNNQVGAAGSVLVSTGSSVEWASSSSVVTLGIGTNRNVEFQQVNVSGVTTSASGFVGNLTGTATTATNLTDAANITTGTINASRLSGTYNIDISGNAATADYADVSGIATYATSAGIATALENARTFEITGDVVASGIIFDGTSNVSLAATIQPNSVALGSDTTGDYVQNISGTSNQITVTSGTGEGSTPTLSIPTQFTAPQDVTVTRDLQVNRNLNVNGNITIGGTSAFIAATELKVYDPDLVLGFRTDGSGNDISNDTTANHGGIAVASTEGNPLVQLYNPGIGETTPSTYKKFMWFKEGTFTGLGTDAWISNYAVGIGSTQFPIGTRLAAGSVQFTEYDLAVVRNINSSGISTFDGQINLKSTLKDVYGYVGTASSVLVSTGTGVRWEEISVAALQGAQGTHGAQGAQGLEGAQGDQGLQGAQGTHGAQGAQGLPGSGTSLTVKEVASRFGATNVTVSNVSEIRFNNAAGFNIEDETSGVAFVDLGSTFNPWYVSGSTELKATGEEPIEFIAGPGIAITTKAVASTGIGTTFSKAITITATGGGGGSGSVDYLDAVTANVSGISTLGFFEDNQIISRSATLGNNKKYYTVHKNLTVEVGSTLVVGSGSTVVFNRFNTLDDLNVNSIVSVGVVTASDFNTTSDLNLKENVRIIEQPIQKLMSINGVNFNWKNTKKPAIGVIAQEIEQILPELVSDTHIGKTVNYNGIIGLLIEAIKEQQRQINELKNSIN